MPVSSVDFANARVSFKPKSAEENEVRQEHGRTEDVHTYRLLVRTSWNRKMRLSTGNRYGRLVLSRSVHMNAKLCCCANKSYGYRIIFSDQWFQLSIHKFSAFILLLYAALRSRQRYIYIYPRFLRRQVKCAITSLSVYSLWLFYANYLFLWNKSICFDESHLAFRSAVCGDWVSAFRTCCNIVVCEGREHSQVENVARQEYQAS